MHIHAKVLSVILHLMKRIIVCTACQHKSCKKHSTCQPVQEGLDFPVHSNAKKNLLSCYMTWFPDGPHPKALIVKLLHSTLTQYVLLVTWNTCKKKTIIGRSPVFGKLAPSAEQRGNDWIVSSTLSVGRTPASDHAPPATTIISHPNEYSAV